VSDERERRTRRVTTRFISRRNRRVLWSHAEGSALLGNIRFFSLSRKRFAAREGNNSEVSNLREQKLRSILRRHARLRRRGAPATSRWNLRKLFSWVRPIDQSAIVIYMPLFRPLARRWQEIYARTVRARPSRISSDVNSVNRKNWRRSLSSGMTETCVTCRKYSCMFREIEFSAMETPAREDQVMRAGNIDIDFTISMALLRHVIEQSARRKHRPFVGL